MDVSDLLSPEGEQPPPGLCQPISHIEGLEEEIDISLQEDLPESKSMEGMDTILLETSPMDESLDLGSDNAATKVVEEESDNVAEGIADQLAEALTLEPSAEEIISPDQESKISDVQKGADIKHYFDSASNGNGERSQEEDFFDALSDEKDEPEVEVESGVNIENHDALQEAEEPHSVPFVELKGNGTLRPTESTRSLCNFFTNNGGGSDAEGKSFFDSFTAVEGELPPSSPRTGAEGTPMGNQELPPLTPPIPSPLPMQPSPLPSPLHRTSQSSVESVPRSPLVEPGLLDDGGIVITPDGKSTPGFMGDPFSAVLSNIDRSYDAWIPSEATRQVIVTVATSPPGTYCPNPDQLTKPGLLITDAAPPDPVRDMLQKFRGDQESDSGTPLTADSVPQNEEGLKKLIAAECWRAATELCARLLQMSGQGINCVNQLTKHSTYTIQLWFCRIALMMKQRLYGHAESECQAFGNLDSPDLYYEYYPDIYQGRTGSMVPFDFRVLHAQLPHYLGKSQEALDRLYYLHAVVLKIISNLDSGLAEDGSMFQLSDDSRKASRELWVKREIQLLFCIGNVLLHIKDYSTSLELFESLLDRVENRSLLLCGIARIYLQLGDFTKSEKYFREAELTSDENDPRVKSRNAMNRGLLALGQNQFGEALQHFQEAVEADPVNAVAVNNLAVCSLYMGKLKVALSTLESLVQQDPDRFLQESILFNLFTLYELESSKAAQKKQALLELATKNKGTGLIVPL